MTAFNFNANDHEEESDFSALPSGDYAVVITSSDIKENKKGNGEYLAIEMQVIEGSHKGRRLWDNITIKHPNDTAVKIGNSRLASICRAVNVIQPKDTIELHDIPLTVKVGQEEYQGEMKNRIKAYKAKSGVKAEASEDAPF